MASFVYFAHPLRGATLEETQANRRAASALVAKITARYAGAIVPIAPWIHLAECWTEEEGRALGLKLDCAAIERCNELWLIGPNHPLTPGMALEVAHAAEHGVYVHDVRGQF